MPGNPGRRTINTTEFQRRGFDTGTKFVAELPPNSTIIAWAKELLAV
jgi:hypothetical protein